MTWHTLEFEVIDWRFSRPAAWLRRWTDEQSDRRWIYRGVCYMTDMGDCVAVAVRDMDESDLVYARMKFDARVVKGDIYNGELGYIGGR